MARPRDIGTIAETATVKVLRQHGFPHAERRALRGAYDCGDITGTPGICWEVKGGKAAKVASDAQIAAWLAETETERINARADIGVLVVQRAGIGPANAHRWWAIVPLSALENSDQTTPVRFYLADMADLLTTYGYGTPREGL